MYRYSAIHTGTAVRWHHVPFLYSTERGTALVPMRLGECTLEIGFCTIFPFWEAIGFDAVEADRSTDPAKC